LKPVAVWARPFDNPILLPGGREIVTLRHAGDYITSLPKAEQDLDEWQAAVEALLLVVELNGPTMMARIGMLRALNRNVERAINSRKAKGK
jgi:cob(I)alamin adenosyltransferase